MFDVAVVGMGRWGRRLVDAVQSDGVPRGDRVRFVAGATRTPDRARAFATAQRLALFDDYAEMIRATDLDGVVIASPHSQHPAHVRTAAAAGLDVFVEKPLALDGRTADDLVMLCASSGSLLAVGFNRRFKRAYRALQETVRSGELGQPLHVEGNFSGPFGHTYSGDVWHADSGETPGGGLTLMGVHVVDCMIGLLGPVTEVSARSRRQHLTIGLDDTTDASLTFASGQTGYVSTLTATASHWRLQVFGSDGWAQMVDERHLTVSTSAGLTSREFPDDDAERAELEAFAAAALDRDRPYPVPLADVVNGTDVLTAAAASIRDGGRTTPVAWRRG